MNTKAHFKSLAYMLEVVKEEKLPYKLSSVDAKSLVGTLANTQAETEMQTLRKTLTYLEEKALVDTVRTNSERGRNILQYSGRGEAEILVNTSRIAVKRVGTF